jgi:hypothetical protein
MRTKAEERELRTLRPKGLMHASALSEWSPNIGIVSCVVLLDWCCCARLC